MLASTQETVSRISSSWVNNKTHFQVHKRILFTTKPERHGIQTYKSKIHQYQTFSPASRLLWLDAKSARQSLTNLKTSTAFPCQSQRILMLHSTWLLFDGASLESVPTSFLTAFKFPARVTCGSLWMRPTNWQDLTSNTASASWPSLKYIAPTF